MKELVLAGRGGEGVVLASQLLAETFARAGFFVQAFPEFKAERRGAPISAFLRWDERPIHRRYKVRDCDVLLSVSPAPPSLGAVRRGGLALLNRETRVPVAAPFGLARVPASRIARTHGVLSAEGRPLGNVALLGAAVRLLLPDGLPFLEKAVRARGLGEPNLASAREGFARVVRQHARAGDAPLPEAAPPPRLAAPTFPVSTRDSRGNETGSWSLDRPAILDACTACGVCALFCPEGAISRDGEAMAIDLRYCKGCGICEVVCPVRGALELEEVLA